MSTIQIVQLLFLNIYKSGQQQVCQKHAIVELTIRIIEMICQLQTAYQMQDPSISRDPHGRGTCQFTVIRDKILKLLEEYRKLDVPARQRAYLLQRPQNLAGQIIDGKRVLCLSCHINHNQDVFGSWCIIGGLKGGSLQEDRQTVIDQKLIDSMCEYIHGRIGYLLCTSLTVIQLQLELSAV